MMKTKKKHVFMAVAGLVLVLAPTAQADLILPLDGATEYRIAFKYSTGLAATSTSIDFYNGLVDTEGDAEIVSDWRVIASTSSIDAIVNTGTTATDGLAASGDVPIYNTLGEKIWDGNTEMWDGTTTPQGAIIFTLAGGHPGGAGVDYQRVWTGSFTDGTGQSGNELGNSTVTRGINFVAGHLNGTQWIDLGEAPNTELYSIYGLSGVISAIPEPSTLSLLALGGLLLLRRLRA